MSSTPLYYIRFLKPPPTEYIIGQQFVIVWTVESDLGDSTYWEQIPIVCSLQGSSNLGLRVLDSKEKKRNDATIPKNSLLDRNVNLLYDPLQGGGTVTKLVIEPFVPLTTYTMESISFGLFVCPSSRGQGHSIWKEAYIFSSIWIIPTWSRPIQATVANQRHRKTSSGSQAERVVKVGENRLVRIREDAEQSIARHIWDCGLELGSGTGLVGIYAAELLQPKKVYLTDLEDALEIMQQNVDLMKIKDTVHIKELCWGNNQQEEYKDVDLILLTDVLYNQSSHDLLLDTLDWLLNNENAKALLSYKERNQDEREFFEKVKTRGWFIEKTAGIDNLMFEIYWIFK